MSQHSFLSDHDNHIEKSDGQRHLSDLNYDEEDDENIPIPPPSSSSFFSSLSHRISSVSDFLPSLPSCPSLPPSLSFLTFLPCFYSPSSSSSSSSLLLSFMDRMHLPHYSYLCIPLCSLLIFLSGAAATYSIGFWNPLWEKDLHLSTTEVSLTWTIASALQAATLPYFGRRIDKFGPRAVTFLLSIIYPLGIFGLSISQNWPMLIFSLTLSRIGAGTISAVSRNVSSNWWITRKGFAISITNSLANIALVWPALNSVIYHNITSDQWRWALAIQGTIVGIVNLLLAFLVLNRPEEYGRCADAIKTHVHSEIIGGEGTERNNNVVGKSLYVELSEMGGERVKGSNSRIEQGNDNNNNENNDVDDHVSIHNSDGNGDRGFFPEDIPLSPSPATPLSSRSSSHRSLSEEKESKESSNERLLRSASNSSSSTSSYGEDEDSERGTYSPPSAASPSSVSNDNHPNVTESKERLASVSPFSPTPSVPLPLPISSPSSIVRKAHENEIHWYWKDAISTRIFWLVNFSNCATSLLWSGFNLHFTNIIELSGINKTLQIGNIAELIFIPIAIIAVFGMLIAGKIFDKIQVKSRGMIVATASSVFAIIFLFLFPLAGQSEDVFVCYLILFLFTLSFGFMNSIVSIGFATVNAYTFGRLNLGTIDSISNVFNTVAVGIGPFLFGVTYDTTHSYDIILWVILALSTVLSIGLALSSMPSLPDMVIELDGDGGEGRRGEQKFKFKRRVSRSKRSRSGSRSRRSDNNNNQNNNGDDNDHKSNSNVTDSVPSSSSSPSGSFMNIRRKLEDEFPPPPPPSSSTATVSVPLSASE